MRALLSYKPGDPRPYWKPENDDVYAQFTFASQWLEQLWCEDARSVPDDWSPDLAARADSAAAFGEQRDYYNWVWDAYDYDRSYG